MTKVVVDQNLLALLGGLKDPVELVDASGKTLAFVSPPSDTSLYEGVDPPITREEAERRVREETEYYTTEEVLRYLESQ